MSEQSPDRIQFCTECGGKLTGGKFCPQCGSPVFTQGVSQNNVALNNTANAVVSQPSASTFGDNSAFAPAPACTSTPVPSAASTPAVTSTTAPTASTAPTTTFLTQWKTNVGMSVLGIFVLFLFNGVTSALITDSLRVTLLDLGVLICSTVFALFCVWYALSVYPKFFGDKPRFKSPLAVSFLNCLAGSFIFGPIWNGNLTKKVRGISHIIYSVFAIIVLICCVELLCFLFCVYTEEQNFIGSWKLSSMESTDYGTIDSEDLQDGGIAIYLDINEDGTAILTYNYSGEKETETCTWELESLYRNHEIKLIDSSNQYFASVSYWNSSSGKVIILKPIDTSTFNCLSFTASR